MTAELRATERERDIQTESTTTTEKYAERMKKNNSNNRDEINKLRKDNRPRETYFPQKVNF